jgi:hypothetical protein
MPVINKSIVLLSCAVLTVACHSAAGVARIPADAAGLDQKADSSARVNFDVVLRGSGSGVVRFRQPRDEELVIQLGVDLRGLEPRTSYVLQRAVDTIVDRNCTSAEWLTLGKGMSSYTIVTDSRGEARADLFRSVAALPEGAAYDIRFRVVKVQSQEVVLASDCLQYTITR